MFHFSSLWYKNWWNVIFSIWPLRYTSLNTINANLIVIAHNSKWIRRSFGIHPCKNGSFSSLLELKMESIFYFDKVIVTFFYSRVKQNHPFSIAFDSLIEDTYFQQFSIKSLKKIRNSFQHLTFYFTNRKISTLQSNTTNSRIYFHDGKINRAVFRQFDR